MTKILKIINRQLTAYPVSSVFIIIGLIISFTVISFGTTTVLNYKEEVAITKQLTPLYRTGIIIDFNNKIDFDDFLQLFNGISETTEVEFLDFYPTINTRKENFLYQVSPIYSIGKLQSKYPIIEGRYFTEEEMNQKEKVVVIGQNMKKYTEVINNKRYIKIEEELYNVIGIVGLDFDPININGIVLIPAPSISEELEKYINKGSPISIILCSENNNTYEDYKKIKVNLYSYDKSSDVNGQIIPEYNPDISKISLNATKSHLLMYVFSMTNCIILSAYWINQRRNEIAIRKAYGYNNKDIIFILGKEMLIIVILSFLISIIVQIILGYVYAKATDNIWRMSYWNLIVGVIFIILTTIVSTLIPAVKTIKLQPAEGIKL